MYGNKKSTIYSTFSKIKVYYAAWLLYHIWCCIYAIKVSRKMLVIYYFINNT